MDPTTKTITYINLVTVILSLPGNVFIIVVNLLDFCKNRRLPVSDRLILGFSVCSLLHELHEMYVLGGGLFHLPKDVLGSRRLIVSTLLFSALLSLHFCLKIVSINHWLYIGLQRRFPKLCLGVMANFLLGYVFLNLYSDTTPQSLLNTTCEVISMKEDPRSFWLTLLFLAFCFLCSLLCSVSASTILIFLLKHMKRIQENSEGSRSPSFEAHLRAVRTISTLLVANILIFTSVFILSFRWESPIYLFGNLIFLSHIFSSYFIIKGTKKLDKTLSGILTRWSCVASDSQ